MKKIVIDQPFGLGDIIFSMGIVQDYLNNGYEVIYPVRKDFLNMYKHFPSIKFVEWGVFDATGYDVLPLRYANNISNNNLMLCMSDKYTMLGKNYNDWVLFDFVRDFDNENRLYYDVLGLVDGEEYNLINNSNSHRTINIHIDNGLKNVYFGIIDGFTIIDWMLVIEKAKNIYTIGTSLVFPVELANTTYNEYVLYNSCYEYNLYGYLVKKTHIRRDI